MVPPLAPVYQPLPLWGSSFTGRCPGFPARPEREVTGGGKAPLPRLLPKSPCPRPVWIAPPAPAAQHLPAGPGSPATDKPASMSQPLGNGNAPYRGVALINVYFK